MKTYSDHVVTKEELNAFKKEQEDTNYTVKGMLLASFVVNVVLSIALYLH